MRALPRDNKGTPEGVGSRIRQVRKLRGLTQQQLAAGTHFSVSLIKKVEAGTIPASYVLTARRMVEDDHPPVSPYYNIDASPLNVSIHWCAVPVENYDGTTALHRGSLLRIVDNERPERVAHHYVDQARAWLLHGDRQQTIASLNMARRIAPNRVRYHPTLRATILSLANSDRAVTGSLAHLARWASVSI